MKPLRRVAKAAGLGPPVRYIRSAMRRESPPPAWEVRGRRDDEHLRAILPVLLRADSNCVDVGAWRGSVLEWFVRLAPRGRHIAYEPLPDMWQDLVGRFPMVDVRRAACSNEDGEATFTHVKNLSAYSGFRPQSYPAPVELETMCVRTERLDSHLPAGYVPALIKVDVEGAEGLVFEGARQTIIRHRPAVVFEHGLAARAYGTSSKDIFGLLCDEAGLRIFDMDGSGPYTPAEMEASGHWNFIAIR